MLITGRLRCRHVAIAAVAAAAGCAGDTAIVLAIHTETRSVAVAQRLELYVGVGAAELPTPAMGSVVTPAWWRRAPIELDAGALVFPDGFGDRVHELALYPSGELALDDELVFAVGAWVPGDATSDALVGFAHVASPTRFGEGEIRRFDVALVAPDRDHGVTATGCAWWFADPTDPIPSRVRDRAIVPATDADCDDFAAPAPGAPVPSCQPDLGVDCDDRRPDVFPSDDPAGQDCTDDDTDCCAQTTADTRDEDGDGVMVCAGDCVDSGEVHGLFGAVVMAIDINPGETDASCNGVDEACAIRRGDRCDVRSLDLDSDDFITCTGPGGQVGAVDIKTCTSYPGQADCLETGTVMGFGNDPTEVFTVEAKDIHPTAADVECDGVDQDCDGRCDDGAEGDGDGDGFPRCARAGTVATDAVVCGNVFDAFDCDDGDFFGRPRPVPEACDGFDSGCDGVPDASLSAQPCLPVVPIGSGVVCQPGVVGCVEMFDGQPAAACMTTPAGPVLPSLTCAPCATGGNPLNCLDDRFPVCDAHTPSGAPGGACTLPMQDRPLGPCPGMVGSVCTWNLVGPQQVGGWRVALIDPASPGPGSNILTAGRAAVRVITVGDQPQGFIVKRQGAPDAFEVMVFQRASSNGCEAMTCTGN